MTDTITGAFIGVAGAIIGAVLAGPVAYFFSGLLIDKTHRNTLETMKLTEFNRSSSKLRATFAPAKVMLDYPRSLGNPEAREFFDDNRTIHAAAIEEFRPFACDNTTYQKAWDDYKKTVYGEESDISWSSGKAVSDDGKELPNFLDVINEKINKILQFASPK